MVIFGGGEGSPDWAKGGERGDRELINVDKKRRKGGKPN